VCVCVCASVCACVCAPGGHASAFAHQRNALSLPPCLFWCVAECVAECVVKCIAERVLKCIAECVVEYGVERLEMCDAKYCAIHLSRERTSLVSSAREPKAKFSE